MSQRREALRARIISPHATILVMERVTTVHVTAIIPRVNPTATCPAFEDFLKRPFLASLAVV